MAKQFKVKDTMVSQEDHAALLLLNRSLQWAAKGRVIEGNRHHPDRLIEELQLLKKQALVTPALREPRKAQRKEEESTKKSRAGEKAHPRAGAGDIGAGR